MSVSLDVLVLPAFDNLEGLPGEVRPWVDRYDITESLSIDGIPTPLRYSDENLRIGVVPTGVGKVAAATTTTALCTSSAIDLENALILSVGVAGGPPSIGVGSVIIASHLVDWDYKVRLDSDTDQGVPLQENPYATERSRYALDQALVEWALDGSSTVDLEIPPSSATNAFESMPTPAIHTGTNVCGDELWHGHAVAAEVEWLVNHQECPAYVATEMEDTGTAGTLARFEHLDRYLSIRGIANADRPPGKRSDDTYLFSETFESGFECALENVVSVAIAIVENLGDE